MTARRPKAGSLDVVRIDVLLWALGGFSETPVTLQSARAIPDLLWRRIEELAALPRTPSGALVRLANEYDRPVGALRVHVSQIRRHGRRPQYRSAA